VIAFEPQELIRNKMKKLKTRRTAERATLLDQWRAITAMESGMAEQGKNHHKQAEYRPLPDCPCPMCQFGGVLGGSAASGGSRV